MVSFDSVALLAFLLHSLLLCLPVHSVPLGPRQADNPPQPATEVSSVTTAVFPSSTCVVTSTTKKDAQGNDIRIEVDVCVAKKDPSSEESSTRITSSSPSSTTSSTTTTTITVTFPPTSSTSPPTSSTSPPTSSTSPPTSSISPLTSSTSPLTTSTSSPIPSPSSTDDPFPSGAVGGSPLAGGADIPTTSTIPPPATSSISVQPSAAGVSAAAESSMPGKKLSVLPIGLGVFAGISVIALIVVGLVTYERTKYRKAFRQRKLAEAGAPMGYGGVEY